MPRRLLILRAGSGAANNLVRSLRAGDPPLIIVGCHDDPFVLKKADADRRYLVSSDPQRYDDALVRIVADEAIDLVIPTSDAGALTLSGMRDRLAGKVFLPAHDVIELCQDKYALSVHLAGRGLPVAKTYAIERLDDLESLFERLQPADLLWCRIRAGTGSFGAIPVRTPAQARSWIEYWQDMRGVPEGSFLLSEYLPGRDFCVQSLWKDGEPILTKMAERLEYLDSGSPSGVSSTPALAKTAYLEAALDTCARAIHGLGTAVAGVFFVDMKQSASGRACITEINAGRFATITNIHDLTGRHNMACTYVRLAAGERLTDAGTIDHEDGAYLVRSVDTVPSIVRAQALSQVTGRSSSGTSSDAKQLV